MPNVDQVNIFQIGSKPEDVRLIQEHFDRSELTGEINWANLMEYSLDYLEDHPADVVIVKYELKHHTGFDFIQEYKAREIESAAILLSERREEDIASEAFRRGFDDYRSKSFLSPRTLENSIEHALKENQKKQKLKKNAHTDHVTGLLNRHTTINRLRGELKRTARNDSVSSILFLDIDNFKKVNDTLGHVAGDKVLKEISSIVKETIRESDFAGRYGGDEILIISPDTDLDGITRLGERIQNQINGGTLMIENDKEKVEYSVSIGCSSFDGSENEQIEHKDVLELIERADSAMYVAKNNGGDQVERRTSTRRDADDIDTKIIFNDDSCKGKVVDYSEAGVRVKCQKPLNDDEPIKICFLKRNTGESYKRIPGKVSWVRKRRENGNYVAGIETYESPPINGEIDKQ